MEHQLRDIKPLLAIPDSSYYLYFGMVLLGIFLLLTTLFFWGRRWLLNRQESRAKQMLRALKGVGWSDAKKASYRVTELGRVLVHDKRSEEIYAQILPLLERYKYKKNVPTVNEETLKQYNLLVHILDESI